MLVGRGLISQLLFTGITVLTSEPSIICRIVEVLKWTAISLWTRSSWTSPPWSSLIKMASRVNFQEAYEVLCEDNCQSLSLKTIPHFWYTLQQIPLYQESFSGKDAELSGLPTVAASCASSHMNALWYNTLAAVPALVATAMNSRCFLHCDFKVIE